MKSVKKVISFILSLAMVLSIIVIPNTSSVSAADTYTYFNANMFKYNTSYTGATSASNDFNASTKALEANEGYVQGIYFNDGKKETTIKGSYRDININNENYNIWSGNWSTDQRNYACTGMAKSELVGGNIQFNYPQADIFDATTVVGGKSTYTNIGIPFKKDNNGNYYYNSDEYDVKFPSDKPESGVNLTVKSGNPQGFYPFSQDNTKSYHFGMNMGVNFYMTSNGHIDGDESKDPIKFEFSGDDDVWVFVDGKLVLDIGGIHDAIAGDIDFSAGKANVYVGKTKTVARTTNIYSSDILGSNWKNDEDKSHTLQVFYLERGQGKSNCKIKFNLPQRDKLEVAKILGNEVKNNDELGTLLQQKFQFQLLVSDTKDGTYKPCSNMKYNLISGTSSSKIGYTDSKGYFELGFGDRALFDRHKQIEQDKFYKVIEVKGDAYTTTWTSTINGKTNTLDDGNGNPIIQTLTKGLQDKTINSYNFVFKNTFKASATDDVVVLDYGKKVEIDVLSNDFLAGATKKIKELTKNDCKNGTLEINEKKDKLIYKPYQYMSSIDRASYSVTIDNVENKHDVSANVKIIPATTVYYEDNFGGSSKDGQPGLAIEYTGNWKVVNDDGTQSGKPTANTNTDNQNDGTIKNDNYGYDSSYDNDNKFSDGSASVVEGEYKDGKFTASANFTFIGTGFDIISRTDADCGTIAATIYSIDKDGKETLTASVPVINKGTNTLYQIPVISYKGLPHGKYKVVITVAGKGNLTTGSKFYLDGIRIYDPISTDSDNQDSNDAKEAYKDDDELYTQVSKLRNLIIKQAEINEGNVLNGAVFIDTTKNNKSDDTTALDEYKSLGPNNEVYLSKGHAIAYKLTVKEIPQAVLIGAKSPNSDNSNKAKLVVSTKDNTTNSFAREINSATDMYYDVSKAVQFTKVGANYEATIVIGNSESAILSLTNLKLKYNAAQSTDPTFTVDQSTVIESKAYASVLLNQHIEDTDGDNGESEKDNDTTDEPQEPVKKLDLEIKSASFESQKVSLKGYSVLKVTTTEDVKSLGIIDSKGKVVQPDSITSTINNSVKTWTVKIKLNKLGNYKYAIYGIGEDGTPSNDMVNVSVKCVILASIKNYFKAW